MKVRSDSEGSSGGLCQSFWPLICLFYECLELGVAECCIGIDVISSTVVLL